MIPPDVHRGACVVDRRPGEGCLAGRKRRVIADRHNPVKHGYKPWEVAGWLAIPPSDGETHADEPLAGGP